MDRLKHLLDGQPLCAVGWEIMVGVTSKQLCLCGLGDRNSVHLSVRLSFCPSRIILFFTDLFRDAVSSKHWQIQLTLAYERIE